MSAPVKFPAGELAKRLKHVSILGSLSGAQLKNLAEWTEVTAFEPGETVVRQGEAGDSLHLILEGSAEVRRANRRLAQLSAGQFFGEMSLFDELPRSADVVALEPSKMAVLKKWEFWGFAASEPNVILNILAEMSRRLRAANEAIAD